MAHIYVNEVINGEFEAYLIQHGEEVTVNGINEGIKNYFENAWTWNPALHGKVEKPSHYVSIAEIVKWLKHCRNGSIRYLPVANIGEDIRFYLTYAPDKTDKLTQKEADLRDRMSQLCEMSNEIALVVDKHVDYDSDKYEDRWRQVEQMEKEYQTLFSETVRIYGD